MTALLPVIPSRQSPLSDINTPTRVADTVPGTSPWSFSNLLKEAPKVDVYWNSTLAETIAKDYPFPVIANLVIAGDKEGFPMTFQGDTTKAVDSPNVKSIQGREPLIRERFDEGSSTWANVGSLQPATFPQ